jgi:hypothetical protein
VCVALTVLMKLIVFFHKKRKLQNMKEQEPVEENEQETRKNRREHVTEIDLTNLNIENYDELAPWEQNAHIWIDEKICSITNENYQQ